MILSYRHTDKNGVVQLVAEMDDDHLLNTIRLKLRQANEIFVASQRVSNNVYKDKLYGRKSVDPELAANEINEILIKLSPYILEAFFRYEKLANYDVMHDIQNLLKSIMQRDGQLERIPEVSLPEKTSVYNLVFDPKYDTDIEEFGDQ